MVSQDAASAAARAKGSKIWRVFEQETCRQSTQQFTGSIEKNMSAVMYFLSPSIHMGLQSAIQSIPRDFYQ